ncbi:hypothetical protein [Kitasatospora cineracea]|uniref:hypothetical protein n=1 Tax=Kitasatospora cineracea TaxID=88074 RepID=UPI0036917642
MTITAETASVLFTAAATATNWKATNLGRMTDINHGGDTWTVLLPSGGPDEPVKAEITWRSGWGGTDYVGLQATWGQTLQIVEAALAATRIH